MKILVAYDGSEAGRRTLDWAARLARDEANSRVIVIGVAAALEAAPPIADAVEPGSGLEKHRSELAEASSTLAAARAAAGPMLEGGEPAGGGHQGGAGER